MDMTNYKINPIIWKTFGGKAKKKKSKQRRAIKNDNHINYSMLKLKHVAMNQTKNQKIKPLLSLKQSTTLLVSVNDPNFMLQSCKIETSNTINITKVIPQSMTSAVYFKSIAESFSDEEELPNIAVKSPNDGNQTLPENIEQEQLKYEHELIVKQKEIQKQTTEIQNVSNVNSTEQNTQIRIPQADMDAMIKDKEYKQREEEFMNKFKENTNEKHDKLQTEYEKNNKRKENELTIQITNDTDKETYKSSEDKRDQTYINLSELSIHRNEYENDIDFYKNRDNIIKKYVQCGDKNKGTQSILQIYLQRWHDEEIHNIPKVQYCFNDLNEQNTNQNIIKTSSNVKINHVHLYYNRISHKLTKSQPQLNKAHSNDTNNNKNIAATLSDNIVETSGDTMNSLFCDDALSSMSSSTFTSTRKSSISSISLKSSISNENRLGNIGDMLRKMKL